MGRTANRYYKEQMSSAFQPMKMNLKQSSGTLPESASLLLDFVRFGAAVLVVIAHTTHPEFRLGYVDRQILGDIAVPVFFVLSGFVIRYVVHTRESSPTKYFLDRASRIYSVVLPAMFFTLVVSAMCFFLDRNQFLANWSRTFDHPILRLVWNLIFISQAWGHNTIPFVNSPFWSLGYECIYYIFFGFLIFFRGWSRVVLCIILASIIGPQVLFLLPIWWLGCWIYDFYVRFRRTRVSSAVLISASVWLASGLILFVAGYRELLEAPLVGFWSTAALRNPLELLGMAPMRATMFAVGVGFFFAIALVPTLFAMDYVVISGKSRWARGFRRMANGTFTIYLMHYPFLVLLLFTHVLKPKNPLNTVLVVTGMCAILIAAAVPIDALKLVLRRRLRALVSSKRRDARDQIAT
jgi:peptidoglycan/LPS O-acetylase OafA/YrhL